jgi:hypothetical protein
MFVIFPLQTILYTFCVGRAIRVQSEERPDYRLEIRRFPCRNMGFLTALESTPPSVECIHWVLFPEKRSQFLKLVSHLQQVPKLLTIRYIILVTLALARRPQCNYSFVICVDRFMVYYSYQTSAVNPIVH